MKMFDEFWTLLQIMQNVLANFNWTLKNCMLGEKSSNSALKRMFQVMAVLNPLQKIFLLPLKNTSPINLQPIAAGVAFFF